MIMLSPGSAAPSAERDWTLVEKNTSQFSTHALRPMSAMISRKPEYVYRRALKVHEATGKTFELQFCTVAHWKNGEIVEENLFYDQVGFLRQIGIL